MKAMLCLLLILFCALNTSAQTNPAITPSIEQLYREGLAKLGIPNIPAASSYADLDNDSVFTLLVGDVRSGNLSDFTESSMLKFGFIKSIGLSFTRPRTLDSTLDVIASSVGRTTWITVTLVPARKTLVSEAIISVLMTKSSIEFNAPSEVILTVESGTTTERAAHPGTYRRFMTIGLDGTLHSVSVVGALQ